MAAHGRRTRSPSPLPKLLLEQSNELFLLLDELSQSCCLSSRMTPDIVQEKVFVFVKVGLMVGLRSGSC
ncbi:hypothetical protein AAC387_Pa06g0873 [Persea americana]